MSAQDFFAAAYDRLVNAINAVDAKTGGGGGANASGLAEIDFGVWPGERDAELVIVGQAGITAGAKIDAWVIAAVTADHNADEHRIDPPLMICGAIVPNVGFTIFGQSGWSRAPGKFMKYGRIETQKPIPKLYGRWAIAWRWQ